MKRKQQGFTLIELMIVVAIIAILAAIAIPLYLNYTAQAEGSEATTLADGAKTAIVAYYNENGSFPANNSSAGEASSKSINGKYVFSVNIDKGVITATFRNGTGVAKPIQGAHIILSPYTNAGSVAWTCQVTDSSGGNSTSMYKYVPSNCRHPG